MNSRINKLEYKFEISNKCKFYYKNDDYHREKDLPAIIWSDFSRTWYKNGLRHRDNNRPSIIYSDGRMFWWENGKYIKDNYNDV